MEKVTDKNYFLLRAVGFKQNQKHNSTTKSRMTSVHALGTTLMYAAHSFLITTSIMILVIYAFNHKIKQTYAFKQLE